MGQNLGPFDLTALPIGCFRPARLMQNQHMVCITIYLFNSGLKCIFLGSDRRRESAPSVAGSQIGRCPLGHLQYALE
jgi:hypothetical protein